MATFDTTVHPLAFAHMEGGMKTVYVVPNTAEFSVVTSGDRIEFDDLGFITVGAIRRYPNLAELMAAEGWENVIPEAESEEQAIEVLMSGADWTPAVVAKRGLLALRVREARRKS